MNKYKCPICQATSFVKKLPYKGESIGFCNKSIVECNTCHLLSIYPFPTDEELSGYYKSYWGVQDFSNMLPLFQAQAMGRYEFFESYLPNNDSLNVMDVGAGFGLIYTILAKKMHTRTVMYDVVEIDPIAVTSLKNFAKPRNIYSDIKDSKNKYHVLILSHILEHLKDPLQFLIDQQARTVQNGILFIEVPNQDYLFKSRNEPHLIFFTPETLVKLVEVGGYKVLRVETCGYDIASLQNKIQRFTAIGNFLNVYFPKFLINIIRILLSKKSPVHDVGYVLDYGADKQWIRLVALRP